NEILSCLADLFTQNNRDHWVGILRDADMVAAKVNTLLEASNDPNVVANNYVKELFHPELGENIKVHGSPWKFSETPSNPGFAPALGEHNQEILQSIGYDDAAIENLKSLNVI
ncbi:MAG: CoA transferase, partial [SAR202 cluster bacterium]|nr:CoA transferase [SAR202 cluster bacterium]